MPILQMWTGPTVSRARFMWPIVALVVAVAGMSAEFAAGQDRVTALSARADMISGGDVLVRVEASDPEVDRAGAIYVGERDVTGVFHEIRPGVREGLLRDLDLGSTMLSVRSDDETLVEVELRNHPITGPVFSGPHEEPFVCETDQFELPSGETLGVALDTDCSIERRVDYAYRSIEGGSLIALPDPMVLPDDLAYTRTSLDVEVPYIVRVETGTINRAVYQIAMLHNVATEPELGPWHRSTGWNGRLIYSFGGGCVNGWYRQGARTGGVGDDVMLRQGYAVASSTLNVFGNNCNDLLAAETMMMVKERFIEAYGVPRFTVGWGCSGGSYQNHQIVDNYPGLLDGIIPGCSFPDVISGTIPFVTDARLLDHYFQEEGSVSFTEEQQRAVAGFLVLDTMPNVSRNAGRITTGEFCPEGLRESLRYDSETNPNGARCDVYDHVINVFGRDPETGFARRPLDNIGVQYGLEALNAGVITPVQFLDLNEKIGGYDDDGQFRALRTAADPLALRAAYETGRVTHGGGGLATTPIIDYRAYSDDRDGGDVHVRYHSFSLRDRLLRANGRTDNHIMLVEDDRYGLYSTASPVAQEALLRMDEWLTALSHDDFPRRDIDQVVQAKPAALVDACWSRDEEPEKITEVMVRGEGRCEALYPSAPAPREVAGGAIGSDILKCQLKPIEPADYDVVLTAEQLATLEHIFPTGVCDWSKSGVEQNRPRGTWLRLDSN
jgi:hypothetical protein